MNSLASALRAASSRAPVPQSPEIKRDEQGAGIDYELIAPHDDPLSGKWALLELRKNDLKNALKMWQIGYHNGELIIWHGHVGGSIQIEHHEVIPMSKTLQEQAIQDARHRYVLKVRKGYLPPGASTPAQITLMAAEHYNRLKPQRLSFPVAVETKLDGIRLWIQKVAGKVKGFSRGNLELFTMKHIFNECEEFLEYLPPGSAIDGELFHPHLNFEEITSIGRTINETHILMPMLDLYIFDVYMPSNPPYEVRRSKLEKALRVYRSTIIPGSNHVYENGGRIESIADQRSKDVFMSLSQEQYPESAKYPGTTKLFITESHQAHSHSDIIAIHKRYVDAGHEGSMIKKQANGAKVGTPAYTASQYLFGRGTRILKVVDKLTSEAFCVRILEATGREKGCALLVLRLENGKEFTVRMTGSRERSRELLKRPELALHKPVTYEYRNMTVHGIPRFPVGIEIRDYEPGYNPLA